MSAGAERPVSMLFQDSQYNWTDDLPVCKQSGIFFFVILKLLNIKMIKYLTITLTQ